MLLTLITDFVPVIVLKIAGVTGLTSYVLYLRRLRAKRNEYKAEVTERVKGSVAA